MIVQSVQENLAIETLAEAIQNIGYRAKIETVKEDETIRWITSAASGYNFFVTPFSDSLQFRAFFKAFDGVTSEAINGFNERYRFAKMYISDQFTDEATLFIDLDTLVPDEHFDDFLRRLFMRWESILSSYDEFRRSGGVARSS